MREAGVNLVTLGVFSWALLEPDAGACEFGWLDDDRRPARRGHQGRPGHRDRLAAAVADPPPPGDAAGDQDGSTLWPGGRQAFCPSSPVYREHALGLCRAMAERYGGHPALALWHVSNELGCHNARCYCDVSAAAFRDWLGAVRRLERLNEAWGTAFWSQHYGDFEEVLPPRARPPSPTPPSSWTSVGSPPTSCSTTSWPSATCCTSCRPACR